MADDPKPAAPPPPVTHVTIRLDVVNNVLQYLGHRPYVEVSELITALAVSSQTSVNEQLEAARNKT